MTSEKPLREKRDVFDNWEKGEQGLYWEKDVAYAVEKEWQLLLKLHAEVITFDEFIIKRHEIFGEFK